jgi:hypothetical protein
MVPEDPLSTWSAATDDGCCLLRDALAVAGVTGDRGGFSELSSGEPVLSGKGAFVEFGRSPLRNRRHVSELCAPSFAVVVTAGLAPKALLVCSSSWPVIGSPLRIW